MNRKEYKRKYREEHKKEIKDQWKKYYIQNREYLKNKSKIYKSEHKEYCKQYFKKWHASNKENRSEYNKKWELKNKEHRKRYIKNNMDRYSYNCSRRRARKNNADGSHTKNEWELLKNQYNYTCPSCYKKEPEIILTEDHIVPLSKNGSDYINNIQPLCRSCNCSKHTEIKKYANNN